MLEPNDKHKRIVDKIYQDFCESEGGLNNHPFQDAWDAYEEKHGDILSGSDLENLVYQAMLYAIQVSDAENLDKIVKEQKIKNYVHEPDDRSLEGWANIILRKDDSNQ